jgi:hypothetical protein
MPRPSDAALEPITPEQAGRNRQLLEAEVIAYDITHGRRLIDDEHDAELRERMDAYRARITEDGAA